MHYHTLAKKDGLGQIAMCDHCSDIHLAIDSLTLRIKQDAFLALSEMIQKALRHPKMSWSQMDPKMFMAQQLFSRG